MKPSFQRTRRCEEAADYIMNSTLYNSTSFLIGRDDFQKKSKKYFGVLVFECRLPKENSLSTCGTFTRTPIPPRNTTILTEFLDKGRNKTFPRFSCFFGRVVSVPDQTYISYQEKHYGCVGKWPGYVPYPPPVLV